MTKLGSIGAASAALVALVALVAISGCGINPDDAARVIADGQRSQLDPVDARAGAATGESRVFMLTSGPGEDGRLLRSVPRNVPAGHAELMQALFAGPNEEELEAGLTTALPPDVRLLHASRPGTGTLNVDVSPEILELPTSALQLALAQIVYTAGELEGVRAVILRVDGQIRNWPDARGEQQPTLLTVYDFPGYVESAQPPYPAVPTDPA